MPSLFLDQRLQARQGIVPLPGDMVEISPRAVDRLEVAIVQRECPTILLPRGCAGERPAGDVMRLAVAVRVLEW